MRTRERNPVSQPAAGFALSGLRTTFTSPGFRRRTKHGRSDEPLSGRQDTAWPSGPATDVNVPHSCTTRSAARPSWPRTDHEPD